MPKVLVTGAAGFLGTTLVNELCKAGVAVRAVVRESSRCQSFSPGVEMRAADIRHAVQTEEIATGCEAIVHLAAKVAGIDDSRTGQEYEAVNVDGTRYILDAAMRSGVRRIVFASSVKVFGEETDGCIDESQTPDPQTPYSSSKWRAEQLVSEYAERHGLTAVSLRLPMVYGQIKRGNLYQMIKAIDHGRFPVLPRLSAVRSLLHVQNFVQAVLLCLRVPCFNRPAYIVADAEPYCVTDLYDWLRAGLGKSPPQWRVPLWVLEGSARFGDWLQFVSGWRAPLTTEQLTKLIGWAWYSPAAITRELGYQATCSFEKTIPELIAGYRQASH